MSKKRVVVIHSFLNSVEDFKNTFQNKVPEVELVNIIDDSLLPEALANKGLTPGIVRRVCNYVVEAETMGADCVLNQCSSLGEAFDVAEQLISIPYAKVDRPMAMEAVSNGKKIAMIATAVSTVGPSSRVIKKVAADMNKQIDLEICFVDGAYEALIQDNDKDKHNRLIVEKVEKAAQENEVVVLAQGSMYHLLPLLKHINVPVLSYLESGVEQIRNILKL